MSLFSFSSEVSCIASRVCKVVSEALGLVGLVNVLNFIMRPRNLGHVPALHLSLCRVLILEC